MLTKQNLYQIAKSRYDEAGILLANNKADGAVYLCGYALELILKLRIVKTLDWDGYPEGGEFNDYKSFKVHNLNVLLRLSGLEKKIQADNVIYARWQIANRWDSTKRYKAIGTVSNPEAQDIIEATKDTINFVLTSL